VVSPFFQFSQSSGIIGMGLDQYTYKVAKGIIKQSTDFTFRNEEGKLVSPRKNFSFKFGYWRKHYALQHFMENLYKLKGGKNIFNCNTLLLTESDIDILEDAVRNNYYHGVKHYKQRDLGFIKRARKAIANGYDVVYYSWW
jgi:hypothetical protein